jgi:hypothetical protein
MGEIIGIGCPHGPQPGLTDETMANNYFRVNLASEKTPARWKDPASWPPEMRGEWGEDEGVSSAREHRAEALKGYRQAREAIDRFNPDFVLIFGDDQYENFKEDLLPPFCVYALDEFPLPGGWGARRYRPGGLNLGTPLERPPLQTTVKGSKRIGTWLANSLLRRGIDVPCSWKLGHLEALGHAFTRTVDYLDWDRTGFPYAIVPFHVSCYGEDLRVPTAEAESVVGRLAAALALLRCRPGGGGDHRGEPVPRGHHRLLELVACLAYRNARLPLGGRRLRPRAPGAAPERAPPRVARSGPGQTSRLRPARDAQLDLPGRRHGGPPRRGPGLRGDVHL